MYLHGLVFTGCYIFVTIIIFYGVMAELEVSDRNAFWEKCGVCSFWGYIASIFHAYFISYAVNIFGSNPPVELSFGIMDVVLLFHSMFIGVLIVVFFNFISNVLFKHLFKRGKL